MATPKARRQMGHTMTRDLPGSTSKAVAESTPMPEIAQASPQKGVMRVWSAPPCREIPEQNRLLTTNTLPGTKK